MGKQKPKNLLFVCFANINRSPTAVRVCSEMLKERGYKVYSHQDRPKNYDYALESAGTHTEENWGNQMTTSLGEQMAEIYALDDTIRDFLINTFLIPEYKIYNLKIPNTYRRDEPQLVELLRKRLEKFLPKKKAK